MSMTVSELRAVVIVDTSSAVSSLNQINQQLGQTANTMGSLADSSDLASSRLLNLASGFGQLGQIAVSAFSGDWVAVLVQSTALAVNFAETGLSAIESGMSKIIATGIEFNASMEQARVGIAAVIAQNNNIKDMSGRDLVGLDALRAAEPLAESMIAIIKVLATTTSYTTSELVTTFQSIAGAGLRAGLNTDGIAKSMLGFANAAYLGNMEMGRLNTFTREILQGNITNRNQLAAIIGITKDEVQEATKRHQLQELLNQKLQVFEEASAAIQNQWKNVTSNIKDAGQMLSGDLTRGLQDKITASLQRNFALIYDVDTSRVTPKLQPVFEELKSLFDRVGQLGADALDFVVVKAIEFGVWLGKHREAVDGIIASLEVVVRQMGGMVVDIASIWGRTVDWNTALETARDYMDATAIMTGVIRDAIGLWAGYIETVAGVVGTLLIPVLHVAADMMMEPIKLIAEAGDFLGISKFTALNEALKATDKALTDLHSGSMNLVKQGFSEMGESMKGAATQEAWKSVMDFRAKAGERDVLRNLPPGIASNKQDLGFFMTRTPEMQMAMLMKSQGADRKTVEDIYKSMGGMLPKETMNSLFGEQTSFTPKHHGDEKDKKTHTPSADSAISSLASADLSLQKKLLDESIQQQKTATDEMLHDLTDRYQQQLIGVREYYTQKGTLDNANFTLEADRLNRAKVLDDLSMQGIEAKLTAKARESAASAAALPLLREREQLSIEENTANLDSVAGIQKRIEAIDAELSKLGTRNKTVGEVVKLFADEMKKQTDLADIGSKLAKNEDDRSRKALDNHKAQIKTLEDLSKMYQQIDVELLKASGNTFAAGIAEVDRKHEEQLKKLRAQATSGDPQDQAQAQAALAKLLQLIAFEKEDVKLTNDKLQVSLAQSALDLQKAPIQAQLNAGLITEQQAKDRIAAIESGSVAGLRQKLELELQDAIALNKQAEILSIQKELIGLQNLGLTEQQVQLNKLSHLMDTNEGHLNDGVLRFLSSTKTMGDAMADFKENSVKETFDLFDQGIDRIGIKSKALSGYLKDLAHIGLTELFKNVFDFKAPETQQQSLQSNTTATTANTLAMQNLTARLAAGGGLPGVGGFGGGGLPLGGGLSLPNILSLLPGNAPAFGGLPGVGLPRGFQGFASFLPSDSGIGGAGGGGLPTGGGLSLGKIASMMPASINPDDLPAFTKFRKDISGYFDTTLDGVNKNLSKNAQITQGILTAVGGVLGQFANSLGQKVGGGGLGGAILGGLFQGLVNFGVGMLGGGPGGGGGFGGGFSQGIKGFFGGKATGGSIGAGEPKVVGEEGEELFVPDTAGTIVPNSKLGRGTHVTVNNYITFKADAPDGKIAKESQMQTAARLGAITQRAVERYKG